MRTAETPAADGYVSLKELASYSGMSERTLRTYLTYAAHPLPHYHIGRRVLVKRSEFDAWMQSFPGKGTPAKAALEARAWVRKLAGG